jgi:type 1 glutamine amidotransferase
MSGGASPGGNGGSAGGVAAGGASGAAGTSGSGGEPPSAPPNILVFSHTAGFRHDSIPNGIAALTLLADERDWTLTATEDPTLFNDGALAPYDVIVFLSSSGDVFDAEQQAAFERFIRTPSPRKGFVGIHAASTTEYDWPFFGELVGAFFREHPEGTAPATIVVEDATHPSTASLPARWTRTDEWYAFRTNPRANVTVLLSLDETTYAAGAAHMDGDHPIAWFHTNVGARAFYTALGHTAESYTEPLFLDHVATAIEWAAGR